MPRKNSTQLKMSAAQRKRWADPVQRAQLSLVRKKVWADPDRREKLSQTMLAYFAKRRRTLHAAAAKRAAARALKRAASRRAAEAERDA
jgi:16S rRNA A1518/A1519 N6-dimethyltransferase RsmA/KsgA/DIM1 with predicted DNA glycosylase/AP lyase activity